MKFPLSLAGVAILGLFSVFPLVGQNIRIIDMAGSYRHIVTLWSDGTVTAMGDNRIGQLGRPRIDSMAFQPAGRVELPTKALQVAASEGASFALLDDGTVWAWGSISSGQLGVDLKGVSERHTPSPIAGLRDVVTISAEMNMGMAVLKDGTVMSWGALPYQQSGGRPVYQPVPVSGLADIVSVSGGSRIGFALTRDGYVMSWGVNNLGQLGLGSTSKWESPTRIPTLKNVVSVARVNGTGVAVTRDGHVWTWGHNGQAGLGNGLHADTMDPGQPTPQQVSGMTDAIEVKTGPTSGRHIIVRRKNRTLISWGNTDWGQLGTGAVGFQPVPTAIKLPDVESYWAFGNHSFARTANGDMWFWGNQFTALWLLGTNRNQRVPAKVPINRLQAASALQ